MGQPCIALPSRNISADLREKRFTVTLLHNNTSGDAGQ
jgi:hypothetical protein